MELTQDKKKLRQALLEFRKLYNLTQEELSAIVGVPITTYRRWESAKVNINYLYFKMLKEAIEQYAKTCEEYEKNKETKKDEN